MSYNLMNARQEDQIDGLVNEAKEALFEDFSWKSKEQAQQALDAYKAKIAAMTVDQIFDEDNEEE